MNENPYSAPQTIGLEIDQPNDAEMVRRQHIGTEASIKSVGILYFLGGLFMFVAGAGMFMGPSDDQGGPVIGVVLLVFGMCQLVLGVAVRKLAPWSRIGVGILSVIGLIGFPIGTLISGYILYLVFGAKGRMVYSQPYKQIIAETPHIKYRTSKVVWIVLGVFLALLVLGVVGLYVNTQ